MPPLAIARRDLLAASLAMAGAAPAAAQGEDFRTRLSRLRCGANLERWFTIARDNQSRRLGRAWWRDFKAAGFDHARLIIPGSGVELYELYRQAIDDAMAAGVPILLALQDIVHQGSPEARDWDGLAARARFFAQRTDPEMVVFAPVNEPAFETTATWLPVRDRMLATLRAEAPKHLLMWGGREWNSVRSTLEMAPPADPWTIVEMHDYGGGTAAEVRRRYAPVVAWRERYRLPIIVAEYNAYGSKQEKLSLWITDLREGLPVLRSLNIPATLWSYSHGGWYRLQPEDGPAPHPEVRALLAS